MTQSQWMKGCPEGGEQSFLFSLYTQLSEGRCACPHDCAGSVERRKSDFFAMYVSGNVSPAQTLHLSFCPSRRFRSTSSNFARSFATSARPARKSSVLRAASRTTRLRSGQRTIWTTSTSSTARTCRESSSASACQCWRIFISIRPRTRALRMVETRESKASRYTTIPPPMMTTIVTSLSLYRRRNRKSAPVMRATFAKT